MLDKLKVSRGSNILIGAPTTPINELTVAEIASAVAKVSGVREAHMPQVYIPGVSESPAQVLVLALNPGVRTDHVMEGLAPDIHRIVPQGIYLDIWPLPLEHELLPAVRSARCQIFGPLAPQVPVRKWWQFWR